MILKLTVLVFAVLQVVAAGFLNIGDFDNTDRALTVFIQPAGWAFSIWGLIYMLSFIYAVYQVIPKKDNDTLRATRVPALTVFASSIAWLYFAGQTDWTVWLTIPILFVMALSLVRVVRAPGRTGTVQTTLSRNILYPYAAWTGIASWLNIQAILNDQLIITNETVNLLSNGVLFLCIAFFTLYFYRATDYSAWYGGILAWAGAGVVYANQVDNGSIVFAVLGGLLAATAVGLYIRRVF